MQPTNYLSNRAKQRGKGAPKKKRTAEGKRTSRPALNAIALIISTIESKKFKGKKKATTPAIPKA